MNTVKSTPDNSPVVTTESSKSDIFTAACSAMKAKNITEGQRIVANPETMGKPPTLTAACEAMKEEIKDEAQQILANPNITAL